MNVSKKSLQCFKHAASAFVCFIWLSGTMNLRADGLEYEGTGASTNGIYASIKYSHIPLKGMSDLIEVFYHFTPPSTNIPFISPFGEEVTNNGHLFVKEPFYYAIYFSASNLFCGVVQLTDSESNQIPSLRSGISSQADFPQQYSLEQVREGLRRIDLMIREPVAITGTGLGYGFGRFNLPDTFMIEKPGEYQLTVWPKIYMRSKTNSDLVERIDLPPVTIPVKWTGNAQK